MDRTSLKSDCRQNFAWMRVCCIAAATICAAAGGVVLAVHSEAFKNFRAHVQRHNLEDNLPDQDTGGVVGPASAGIAKGVAHARRGMQELDLSRSDGNGTLGEAIIKPYSSFAEYALENSQSWSSLPVPVVRPVGQTTGLTIPIVTIIGAQKGGTSNLRGNLVTHPMVSSFTMEVHFFDRPPSYYPAIGQWEGDGLSVDVGVEDAGEILLEYAKACMKKDKERKGKVIVDSSPRYLFDPVVPYRMRMVLPGSKFVVVLRDPTDRYFSQLRMDLCKDKPDPGYTSLEELLNTFHPPGEAKGYLARANARYEPYTPLCRGENASSSDLEECYQALRDYNPLFRGLYADQLERWFRVFDRSRIMVVNSSDMFEDFTAVVTAVAAFAGLPEYEFVYDPSRVHKSFQNDGAHQNMRCGQQDQAAGTNYFSEGGRYPRSAEESEVIREWYQPHNQRLYNLLGRDFMWP